VPHTENGYEKISSKLRAVSEMAKMNRNKDN